MGRVEGLPAWDPADPDAPAGSGSELRGSRVAHVRQVCRPRAFTEMLAFAGGARAVSPTPAPPPPAQTRGLVHSSGESKRHRRKQSSSSIILCGDPGSRRPRLTPKLTQL